MSWLEVAYAYPPCLRASYRKGRLFRQWFKHYQGHLLFHERMFSSAQIPHSGPIEKAYFFHEFFMGTQYLHAGYEALLFYREAEHKASYEKAKALLGGSAAAEIIIGPNERKGRPPDLLIFDHRTGRFHFVECKGMSERFTKWQERRFADIEKYLNQNPPPCKQALDGPRRRDLFPSLLPGQWIHVVRLAPKHYAARLR